MSDMIEDELLWSNFVQFILIHNCFVGVSVYNIQELRDRPSIYKEFRKRFTSLPTFLIKPTENFKLGIVAATGAIALVYFVTIILGFFGVSMPMIYGSGPIGIGFSLVVVTIAAQASYGTPAGRHE